MGLLLQLIFSSLKMNMIKGGVPHEKLKLLLASIMILTCLSPGAYAQDGNLKISPEEAAERVSLSFMQNTLDPNVEISSTIPFYDLNNNVTAYCVSFELNGAPNGYVLISLLNMEMPIVEFALEGNGIYDLIQVPQNSRNSATLTLPVIRYLGPGLLFVEDSVSNTLYNVETQKATQRVKLKTALYLFLL